MMLRYILAFCMLIIAVDLTGSIIGFELRNDGAASIISPVRSQVIWLSMGCVTGLIISIIQTGLLLISDLWAYGFFIGSLFYKSMLYIFGLFYVTSSEMWSDERWETLRIIFLLKMIFLTFEISFELILIIGYIIRRRGEESESTTNGETTV